MYNWSVIHGIKRKPHLSVVWNWYHFVAIAILHQPRPTDSADINTRLQLSDTSSIPPMHGGFLLILQCRHMSVHVSQVTGNSTACSTVVIGTRNIQLLYYWVFVKGIQDGFPSQRASNAESTSMRWCLHAARSRRSFCTVIIGPLVGNRTTMKTVRL